jgi:hypothetical protein
MLSFGIVPKTEKYNQKEVVYIITFLMVQAS